MTIELETPVDDIPPVNDAPKNQSEDTLSNELFNEVDFPPEYFQTQSSDDGKSSD